MAKIKVTKSALEAAQPEAQSVELRETLVPGFLCMVTPAGRKVFMLQYRTNAGVRRNRPRERKAKPPALSALVPVQIVHPSPAPLPDAASDCIIRLPGWEISLHNPSPAQLSALLQAIMRGGRP